MKKEFELVGLGNGLVDIQYRVSDEVIQTLGLSKGGMILVDSESQNQIIKKLGNLERNLCSGGSAANSIIAYAQFGGIAAYKTALGIDEYGEFYSGEFKDLGIELKAKRLADNPTGTCLILITPDSERTMCTSLGASAFYGNNDVDEEIISKSEWLYIEGYKFSAPESTEAVYKALEFAKKHDTKLSVTFSDVFITSIFKDNLSKVVEESNLIFCNETEALSYTQKDNYQDALTELRKVCPNVALTLGSEGAVIAWEGQVFNIPAYKTIAVDSTGAGDMFAGAFLFGLSKMNSIVKAGNLASLAASKIVSQLGARMNNGHNQLIESINSKFN